MRYHRDMSSRPVTKRSSTNPAPKLRARRGSGGITLSNVAKVAGVSAITASRALNTSGKVSPDALKRVHDAIKIRPEYVCRRLGSESKQIGRRTDSDYRWTRIFGNGASTNRGVG